MTIQTRLKIAAATSAALVFILALLLYWSQHRLASANRTKNLADEIVSSVFERKALTSGYLVDGDLQARDRWLLKQNHINDLLEKAPSHLISISDGETFNDIRKSLEGSSAIFDRISHNREAAKEGAGHQVMVNEIEDRLVGQMLVKFLDTVAHAHRLQLAANELIASTQRTAEWISLSIIVSVSLFLIIVAWSLGRSIGQGIESLQLGSAAIGEGDLHYKIPLTGDDEFANVARAFNMMSGKLVESRAGLEQELMARKRAGLEIEQLNRELNLTVSQLQGANQELEAFAYSVSHDLRAPLRAMGSFSAALVEDFGDRLEEEARDYLDEIVIGSRHMGQLIDGLLTLSRSTRGELHSDLVDLTLMAHHIQNELAQSEPERGMQWQVDPGLITRGDARMIEVVMNNLLGNAWKYTAGTAQAKIRIYAEQDGDERYFCVADNGAGFDMAHAGKLFQPFQRLHRQDEFPGIGIGLATVQRIVHRHGGKIQGAGEPRKGAIFRFSLPHGKKSSQEES